jgi:hypothetical protein
MALQQRAFVSFSPADMQTDSSMPEAGYRIGRLALVFLLSAGLQPMLAAEESTEPKQPAAEQAPSVDDKTMSEIIKAEEQLAAVIQKHDAGALDRLLLDQYMSAEEGGEWAVSKRGALLRCRLGKLPSYEIELERRFRRDRQAVVLEGLARPVTGIETKDQRAQFVQIRHFWLKQGDHWVLGAQTLPRREAEGGEKD